MSNNRKLKILQKKNPFPKKPSSFTSSEKAKVEEMLRISARIKNKEDSVEHYITSCGKAAVTKSDTARKRAASENNENQDCSEADNCPSTNSASEVASLPQSDSFQDAMIGAAKEPRRRKSAKPRKFKVTSEKPKKYEDTPDYNKNQNLSESESCPPLKKSRNLSEDVQLPQSMQVCFI